MPRMLASPYPNRAIQAMLSTNPKIMTASQIRSKWELLDVTGALDTRVVWIWVIGELCFRSMLVCSPLPPSWPLNPLSKLTK